VIYTYYAAFVPGMQELIKEVILKRLPDTNIKKLLDGAVLFETSCSYDKLNFFCFHNILAVIDVLDMPAGGEAAIDRHMRKICAGAGKTPPHPVLAVNNKKIQTFRVMAFRENKPVQADERIKLNVAAFIAGESALTVNRSKPDTEFWFLLLNEGFSVFMKRLTLHASNEKRLHPGELPPPLAWMMCRLSQPVAADLVLDPFCGYGAIPSERIKRFPLKKMFAFDIKDEAIRFTREKIQGESARLCLVKKLDLFEIFSELKQGSVGKIITDPPWGLYEAIGDIGAFYAKMLRVFNRLLAPGGIAVILSARKEEFHLSLETCGELTLNRVFDVLVSGKKASIFCLKKT
jgi:23S rRNA G2445 N2-methylase RlmL